MSMEVEVQSRLPGMNPAHHQCHNCHYATKNEALFARHLKRCQHPRLPATKPSKPLAAFTSQPGAGKLPVPPFCRNYRCPICPYRTSQAKHFLYHKLIVHKEVINVVPCDLCEYASKNKHKTLRHRKLVHKGAEDIKDLPAVNEPIGIDPRDIGLEGAIMSDENQNEVIGLEGVTGFKTSQKDHDPDNHVEDDFDDEDEEFEEVDEDVSFRSQDDNLSLMDDNDLENRPYLGSSYKPKPTENAYDYIMLVSEPMETPLYQCRLCTYTNPHKWKIAGHIRAIHMKQTMFKCPYCDFVCRRKIEWCVHKTKHTNKMVFSCKECLYRTTMRRNFDRHLAKHKNGGPIKCTICSYSSTGEAAIQRHMAEYHDSPEKEKENLILQQQHQQQAASAASPIPNMDGVIRSSSPKVRSTNLACEVCGVGFATESKLRLHMTSHSGATPWHCPSCNLKYKRPSDLSRHMKKKHGMGLKEYNEGRTGPFIPRDSEDRYFETPQGSPIPYESGSPSDPHGEQEEPLNLSTRKRSLSDDDDEQDEPLDLSTPRKDEITKQLFKDSLACEHCDYVGKWPSDLQRHQASHSLERPFACQLCPSTYKYQYDLNSHVRKAHNLSTGRVQDTTNSPMQCPHCEFATRVQDDMNKHMKTHLTVKPWACVFCKYKCVWQGDMKCHLQDEHPTEIEKCEGDLEKVLAETFQDHLLPSSSANTAAASIPPMTDTPSPRHVQAMAASQTSDEFCAANLIEDPINRKASYKCPYCVFVCEAPSKLKCHVEIHGNLKRFMCAHCGRRSNWLWDVRKHIKKEHPGFSLDVVELPEEEAKESLEQYMLSHHTLPGRSAGDEMEFQSNRRFSTPVKATDKCRPYMCSQCGRRSNWRWDLNKHIRTQHPNAYLITLSDQEAKDTFEEYEKSLQQQATKDKSQELSSSESTSASGQMDEPGYVKQLIAEKLRPFKCSTCGKRSNWKWDVQKHIKTVHKEQGEVITLGEEEARSTFHEVEIQQLKQQLNKQDKVLSGTSTSASRVPSQSHVDLSKLKRFKCSMCPYRSNFRSDIGRHIKRKHRRGLAKVTQLDPEEAASTLEEYHKVWARKKFVPTPNTTPDRFAKRRRIEGSASVLATDILSAKLKAISCQMQPLPDHTEQMIKVKVKTWRCGRCDFEDDDKEMVKQHLQVHLTCATYMCKECGDTFYSKDSLSSHFSEEHDLELEGREDGSYETLYQETGITECEVDVQEVEVEREVRADLVVTTYKCRLCAFSSTYRSVLKQHAVDVHATSDEARFLEEDVKVRDYVETPQKSLRCVQCPFKSSDQAELDSHIAFHQPHPNHPFKCHQCPFWASVPSQLDTHLQLHEETDLSDFPSDSDVYDFSGTDDSLAMPPPPSTPTFKAKHFCEHCPYVSANRNDYLYHKQFHRPKPAAPFKCDLCPYWVSLRRLLKQHVKVHSAEYQERYRGVGSMIPPSSPLSSCFSPSPVKSTASSDTNDDVIDLAHIKQQIIASKISSVAITPHKLQDRGYSPYKSTPLTKTIVVDHRGELSSVGVLRTMHKCKFCPYRNVRSTNLKLHEKMHGNWGVAGQNLHKCPHCDYHVGNAGVLARHVKVHSYDYDPRREDMNDIEAGSLSQEEDTEEGEEQKDENDPEKATAEAAEALNKEIEDNLREADSNKLRAGPQLDIRILPRKSEYYIKQEEDSEELTLERAVFKRWCCERCPYATMKKAQFERHLALHGSGQKYRCEYCDYSVPGYHLLLQHKKLHLMPNPNLLTVQSVANLQKLPTVPADIAMAGHLPGENAENSFGIHDSMDLFENREDYCEPKKIYRCPKCPYTNVRRDHLLQHMKFHMLRSELQCPYCTYSVSKTHLLNQHIRVHFTGPGDEMCAISKEDGEEIMEEPHEEKYMDLSQAKKKPISKTQARDVKNNQIGKEGDVSGKLGKNAELEVGNTEVASENAADLSGIMKLEDDDKGIELQSQAFDLSVKSSSDDKDDKEMDIEKKWLCQYCDRTFQSSENLLRHEARHTVGTECCP